VDVGVGEVVPEVVWSWLLAGHGPGQCGLIPDAAEYFPDCGGSDLVTGGRDKKCVTPGELGTRGPIAGVEDLDDLIVNGNLRLRWPLDQTMSMCPASKSTCPVCSARVSPVRSPHECISVKNATACHRHGE